jgi:hypothetical protein
MYDYVVFHAVIIRLPATQMDGWVEDNLLIDSRKPKYDEKNRKT